MGVGVTHFCYSRLGCYPILGGIKGKALAEETPCIKSKAVYKKQCGVLNRVCPFPGLLLSTRYSDTPGLKPNPSLSRPLPRKGETPQ